MNSIAVRADLYNLFRDVRDTMKFTLSDSAVAKIKEWVKAIDTEVIEQQKKDVEENGGCGVEEFCWERGFPYAGAIGGALSYTFCPTSIGMGITVRYFGRELDLSEF